MRYTDLIFDLYGTLVDIHTEETDEVWAKTALFFGYHGAHYSGQTLKEAFHTILRSRELQAGQSYECYPDIPFEGILEELFRQQGIDEAEALGFQAAQLFRICSTEYLRVYPGVRETLADLRARGLRLWLLTNAQRVFTAYELRSLGLWDCFDGVYISSDYGFRKPDRRFFQTLLREKSLDPKTCLMIGNDRLTDIAGARALGIHTLFLHTGLTPADQAPAQPAPPPEEHEYQGDNWQQLLPLLLGLIFGHQVAGEFLQKEVGLDYGIF